MSEHPSEHEDLVRDVVVGDTPADAPEVVRRRRACPACARLLDRAARTAALLGEEAAEELAVLALAQQPDVAVGEERIAAFRSHPEFRRRLRPPRRGLRWAIVAGAAAVLSAWLLLRGTGVTPPRQDPRRDVTLGAAQVVLEPFDGFGDDLVLRWTTDPAIAADVARYELTIEGDGTFERFQSEGERWSDPSTVRNFPDEITVTVLALGHGRQLGKSEPLSGRRAR
jgi:hypothetical protein